MPLIDPMAEFNKVQLDYDDAPLEPEADVEVVAPRYERTTTLPPGAGRFNWEESRAALIAHRLARGRNADGTLAEKSRAETEEAPITILEVSRPADLAELPRKAKALVKRAEASGWEVLTQLSRTHVAATLFQEDSKEGEPNPHRRGEVRWPQEDQVHYGVVAARRHAGQVILAFEANYTLRIRDGRKDNTDFTYGFLYIHELGKEYAPTATDLDEWLADLAERGLWNA